MEQRWINGVPLLTRIVQSCPSRARLFWSCTVFPLSDHELLRESLSTWLLHTPSLWRGRRPAVPPKTVVQHWSSEWSREITGRLLQAHWCTLFLDETNNQNNWLINPFSAGIVFIRRIKTIPALKQLNMFYDRRPITYVFKWARKS